MDEMTKKGILLLKSIIFHHHGLEEEEKEILEQTAKKIDGNNELKWANNFIAEDYISAFDRSRLFLKKIFLQKSKSKRINHLVEVWEDSYKKGFLTEMETTAILLISKDWEIDKKFFEEVKN